MDTPPAPQVTTSVFDNFNRTIGAGYTWGTASSGAQWTTHATAAGCPGYKVSVDGQAGKMMGSDGATLCNGAFQNKGIEQEVGFTGSRPWEGPSFALTGRFKVDSLVSSFPFPVAQANIYIRDVLVQSDGIRLDFYQTNGTVSLGSSQAPMTWQPSTWYAFKWAVVYGDQQRLKVWPAAQSEPMDWLLASTFRPLTTKIFGIRWEQDGPTIPLSIDDLTFGPAPILPKLPPPTGTDHNSPDPNSANGGDPVNTLTGSFGYHHTDVSIPGRGPTIDFARSYNSNDSRSTSLGPGWTHSYNIGLYDPNDGSSDVILVGPQGRSDRYILSGGTFIPPAGVYRSLVKNTDDTYTATDKAQTVWQFDPSGRLTQIADRYGNASNLSYDLSGRLTTVSDPAGRGSLTLAYSNGLLTGITDWASPARTVNYQYDGSGRLWKVIDREGKTTTFGYDGTSPRLVSITDARANTALTLTYDANGRVATQKDARGLTTGDVTMFDYIVNGDGTRVTTVTSPTTSFEPSFHPTTVDSYDANGWLTSRVAHPSSTETLTASYEYDAAGNRTSVTDPRGSTTNFCFDVNYSGSPITGSSGNLTRTIDPAPTLGANRPVTLIGYDAKSNVIQRVAPRGVPSGTTVSCSTNLASINTSFATDFAYDASATKLLSKTTRFTDPDSGLKTATVKYEYGDAANPGLITRIIPPRGNTTGTPDYTYATTTAYFGSGSKAGLLSSVTDPLGDLTTYDYDSVGRLITVVDPLGNPAIGGVAAFHTTTFTYDKEDRLLTRSDPAPLDGGAALVTRTTYDEVGNPVVRFDANGQVTTYSYDGRDSLQQVKESPNAWTDPSNPPAAVITTEYAYDAAGNPTRVTRAKGDAATERVSDHTYDGRGLRRGSTEYPAWPTTTPTISSSTTYDPNGNRASSVDSLGQTTTYGYDALDRLASISYSDGITPNVTLGYDANGNRTSMADGTGASSFVFDEANRLNSATTPGPKVVGYRYDVDGNKTKTIYPDATAVTYAFNKASQLASLQDWGSRTVAYTYWPDGLVKTATNPDATVATYAYDNARRLIDIAHSNSAGAYLDRSFYTLAMNGNVANVNHSLLAAQFARPDGLMGSNGTWTGTFASINEVTPNDATFLASPSGPVSPNFYEVSLSNVLAPMDLTGMKLHYRVSKSGNDSGQQTNLLVELRQGSTVVASVSHTNLPGSSGTGWLDKMITLSAQQASAITDFADLRLRFTPTTTGGGQARKAQISWAEVDVPSPADPAQATAYTYDGLSRLVGSSGSNGSMSYGYDPAGNRITATVAGTTTSYAYDRADRMLTAGAAVVSVNMNGNTTNRGSDTFGFDQANRMTAATVAGATEAYVYDGTGLRFTRQVGAGTPIRYVTDGNRNVPVTIDDGSRKYVYGIGLAFTVSGNVAEIYHADRLGSVRAITTNGGVTGTYRADDWGKLSSQTGATTQPYKFAGEPADATGLTYLRARYYDPSLARFVSRDPILGLRSIPTTLNRFGYVLNNPGTLRDPSGLWTVGICGGVDANFFGLGPEGQVCVVASSNLEVGLTYSYGGGFILASNISASLTAQVSNANCVEDLGGTFWNVGGGAEVGGGLQGSGFSGKDSAGRDVYGGTFGAAVGAGATFRATYTDTKIIGTFGQAGHGCKPDVLR